MTGKALIRTALMATSASLALALAAAPAEARVTKITIEKKTSPAFNGQSFGEAGQYEILVGKAYGELDPKDPHNAIIQDINLAPKNANGKVEYMATFQITKPVDMAKASHLMWHDVPNRGGRLTIVPAERNLGDVGLSSGWQGDNIGATAPKENNDYVTVPVAHNPDGSAITGPVLGRIMNASGPNSQMMYTHTNPIPYKPFSLDTSKATLVSRVHETMDGKVEGEKEIAASDWAFAKCDADHPFPGTPDPQNICVKGGFEPNKVYQVVYTAKDPLVLGAGFAAFRDVDAFFKHAKADDAGTANPLAGGMQWSVTRGVSQSGNFIRGFLHLGFNQDEENRQVFDGAWPIIAGKRITLDYRFATPDGVSMLYQASSEGSQTWAKWPDTIRGLPASGVLDRCTATNTCPKIVEHFGAAEMWGLKLSPSFVGPAADKDVPLPANVRRYYIGSTQHGGGPGGFSTTPAAPPACPSNGYGKGVFAANPMPQRETMNALRVHMRNWVMKDVAPPNSVYPTLAAGTLVDPTKEAMGFPDGIPGVPKGAPTGFMNVNLDYDYGPDFNYADGTGVIAKLPPAIKHVMPMKAPKVDADGNELGMVPVVLREAPLGTYLGWNVTAEGFHKGQLCNYAGGMIPFAKTKSERMANDDPRLSLEERYGTHEGYVQKVKEAAQKIVGQGFLLQADADRLADEAEKSNVLK
jgi:alpha/beta hydrolase family protein